MPDTVPQLSHLPLGDLNVGDLSRLCLLSDELLRRTARVRLDWWAEDADADSEPQAANEAAFVARLAGLDPAREHPSLVDDPAFSSKLGLMDETDVARNSPTIRRLSRNWTLVDDPLVTARLEQISEGVDKPAAPVDGLIDAAWRAFDYANS